MKMKANSVIFISFLCFYTSINAITNVKHATACEQETLDLNCDDNEKITILYANYGRSSLTVCSNANAKNISCYNQNTVSTLKEICEGEQQCSVQSSNQIFGDPCYGTNKYLFVLYSCAAVKDFKTALACENEHVKLSCGKGQLIRILDANYGRKSQHTCAFGPVTSLNCGSTNSVDIVSDKCNNKQKCNLHASNNKFGDPCIGTFKYLSVKYKCLHGDAEEQIEGFNCNDGKIIPQSLMCNGIKDCSEGDDEFLCDYETKYACEGKTLKIKCNKNENIRLINANFGRLSSTVCPKPNRMKKLHCVSGVAFGIIQKQCEDKQTCELESSAEVFGNPCGNTFKYTEVHYECLKNPNDKHAIDIRSV